MLSLPLGREVRHVLCLGAHCDDIEIGCGGTLRGLAQANPRISFDVVVFASDETRAAETQAAVQRLLSPARYELITHRYRDGFFPTEWPRIKESFEALKARPVPDLVLTHFEHDRHQDHRIISELTWNTFRNHLVLEYEIPKYDGDLGRPNVYLPLPAEAVDWKVEALLASFPSQTGKRWFTADLFRGLMRLRGMECNAPSGYAEAFYARKLTFSL